VKRTERDALPASGHKEACAGALGLDREAIGGKGEPAVGAQLDGDVQPARTQRGDEAFEDADHPATGMRCPLAQHGSDEVVGVTVEDEQRVVQMVHVLAVVAMIAAALLLTMRRIVGAVQIKQRMARHATCHALPFPHIQRHQRLRQVIAGAPIHRILQTREGGLTGQIGARLVRTTTTHELEQRVAPQPIGVVLVFIAAGDLQEALAQQERERMADRPAAPVGDLRREGSRQAQAVVGPCESDESAVGGELPGVKRDWSDERPLGRRDMRELGTREPPRWGELMCYSTITKRLNLFQWTLTLDFVHLARPHPRPRGLRRDAAGLFGCRPRWPTSGNALAQGPAL